MNHKILAIAAVFAVTVAGVCSGTVPEPLVGDWTTSSGSGTSYYDPSTGQHGPPNSRQFAYRFNRDGTFEHAALLQSSLYNCVMTFFGYESGTVVFDRKNLTVKPQVATLRSTDTCVAENNYERPGDTSVSEFTWCLEPDPYGDGQVLVLTWLNGFEEVFRRP